MTSSDVGMAVERTSLSWRRTAIGSMATALLLLHDALTRADHPAPALPLVAAGAMIALAVLCAIRHRALRAGHHEHGHPAVAVTAVTVALVAGTAAVTALVDSFP